MIGARISRQRQGKGIRRRGGAPLILETLERRELLAVDCAGAEDDAGALPVSILSAAVPAGAANEGGPDGSDILPSEYRVVVGHGQGREGDAFARVEFRVEGPADDRTVIVDYETKDGTAVAGNDYLAQQGTLTFPPGVVSQTVAIPLVDDTMAEGSVFEQFSVVVTNVEGGVSDEGRGTVWIADDDFARVPVLSIRPEDAARPEGDAGSTPFVFIVDLSAPSSEVVSVKYDTHDGSAVAGEDYEATSGTFTFAPGETQKKIAVMVYGDTLAEVDQEFRVSLSEPVGARLSGDTAYGTILNDDRFTIPDVESSQFASAEELADYLMALAVQQHKHLFGTRTSWPWWGWWRGILELDGALGPSTGGPESSPSHSETNVQEAGVDEGDIVETDGDYIYLISQGELLIFDALPAEEMHLVSRTALHAWPTDMYLDGDHLTIISVGYGGPVPLAGGPVRSLAPIWREPIPAKTVVTVFDVSDRAHPAVVQKLDVDGSMQTSRMIEGKLYLMMQEFLEAPRPLLYKVDPDTGEPEAEPWEPPAMDPWQDPWTWDGSQEFQFETEAQYRARLKAAIIDEMMPHFTSRGADPDDPNKIEGLLSEPTEVHKPLLQGDNNLISVVAVDTRAAGPSDVQSTSIIGSYSSTTYASTTSIYLVTPYWPRFDIDGWAGEWSSILKFDITESGTRLAATGGVHGRVLNQFSMGEHDGHLRIATTESWGVRARNNVYVLGEEDGKLNVVGKIENIAPGETIFSARFIGEAGFIVTFRRVDPLFALDLSDPARPLVKAELKLPGFSEYLQPLSERYLLGIGRDADPETGVAKGVQINLFDIADLTSPFVVDQYTFVNEQWWSWTPAAYDHHAVGYYPEYDTLALPITSGYEVVPADWDGDGIPESERLIPRSGLWVFDVDLDAASPEVNLRGLIRHNTDVQRSVRVDDRLYSVSYDSIQVHPIDDPDTLLAEVLFMQNFVGMQIEPDGTAGSNLLVVGSGDKDTVLIQSAGEGGFNVRVNGADRGTFARDAVDAILLEGLDGPDQLVLIGQSQLGAVRTNSVDVRLAGDLNGDGKVDLADFTRLKTTFGSSTGDPVLDVDGDGVVGLFEFNALKSNFGLDVATAVDRIDVPQVRPGGIFVQDIALAAFGAAMDEALTGPGRA